MCYIAGNLQQGVAGMAQLIAIKGEDASSVFELAGGSLVIGKPPHAQICLTSPFVSRRHAQIEEFEGCHRLRDLESRNGTRINGERVGTEWAWLSQGDKIELAEGRVVLIYQDETATITIVDFERADEKFRVDEGPREVFVGGEKIVPSLSRLEFDVLNHLYKKQPNAVSKDEIAQAGWGAARPDGDVSDDEITAVIRRIRKRIEPDPNNPKILRTQRGVGYKIDVSES